MRTIKNDKKVIDQLRKQINSLHQKQEDIRKKLRSAMLKAGKNAGKSVRHIHAMRLKKKT